MGIFTKNFYSITVICTNCKHNTYLFVPMGVKVIDFMDKKPLCECCKTDSLVAT